MPAHKFEDRSGIELQPDGDYLVGIEKVELCLSKAGNDQIKAECRIIPHTKKSGPLVYWYGGFTDNQVWTIDVFLKAFGMAPAKGDTVDITDEFLKENFLGKVGWATIGHEESEYKGKKQIRNTLDRWITSGKGDPQKEFDKLFPPQPVEEKKTANQWG